MRTSLEHVETEFQLRWPHDTTLCLTWWFNVLWAFLGIDGLTSPAIHKALRGQIRNLGVSKQLLCSTCTIGFGPRPIERRLDWVFYKTELKIWAVGCGLGWTVLKKVWADYEQLLREVISTFCGQKKTL